MPTFADRGRAIANRLEAVKNDPKYQALPEEHKTKVRADIYKKYVPASYSGFHLPIPDEKTWVEATGRDTSVTFHNSDAHKNGDLSHVDRDGILPWKKEQVSLVDSYKGDKYQQRNQDFEEYARRQIHNVDLFGTKIANRAFMGLFNLAAHFTHQNNLSDLIVPGSTEAKAREKFLQTDTMRMVKNHEDSLRAKIQSEDFWIQSHPRDTVVGKFAGMAGEQVATLPLYEAVGAIGVGGKVIEVGSKLPLTAKLAASPIGRFVARRFVEATDGYLATLMTSGGDTHEAEKGAAGFAVGGAVIEGGLATTKALIKIAAAPLIKKWTANTIAMGGKPFAQELANSGMAEAEIEASHEGEGLAHIKRAEEIRSYIGDVTKNAEVRAWRERELGKLGAQQEQRASEIRAWKERQETRARLDPILHKLHEGEKVSLNSIAIAQFKKNLNQLSKNQRALVLAKRMMLIDQAAAEAPVHLPELHHDEVEQTISKARAANPTMNAFMAEDEKLFGAKFADVVTENQSRQVAHETGIANEPAAGRKVRKVNKEAESSANGRVTESSASLNAYHNDTVSYLRAPRNRKELQEAISDRSAGAYDKLYAKLKEADGGKIQFEKPIQRLLYHYHLAKDLDPIMKRSLQDSIKRQLRKTQGWENLTTAQVKQAASEQSGYLNNHLHVYARTGKFYNGANIYASTSMGGPQSWTKWQAQMNSEVLTEIRDKTLKALKQHPDAAKGYKTSFKIIQRLAMSAGNPEEFLKYQKGLEEMSRAATATAQGKSIQLFK